MKEHGKADQAVSTGSKVFGRSILLRLLLAGPLILLIALALPNLAGWKLIALLLLLTLPVPVLKALLHRQLYERGARRGAERSRRG